MHLCKRWVQDNAFSSQESQKKYLYIILLDDHSPFQKAVFGKFKYIFRNAIDKQVHINRSIYFLQNIMTYNVNIHFYKNFQKLFGKYFVYTCAVSNTFR